MSHQAGQLDVAGRLYREVLESDPKNPDAHHLLGVVAHQRGDHEIAIRHISEAVALNATASDYRLNLGSAHQATGNLDDAIGCFEQSLRLNCDSAITHNNLGNALRQRGRTRESLDHYECALRLQPDYAAAHSNYGVALTELGELEAAQARLERAIEIDPQLVEAQSNLGIIQARRGAHDAAITSYLAALKQQPRLSETWSNLGNLLRDRGDIEDARSAYLQVGEIRQQPVWALRAASLCPVVMGSNEEIVEYRAGLGATIERFGGLRMTVAPDDLGHSNCEPPFHLPYHGLNDRPLKQAYAELFRESIPELDLVDRVGPAHIGFVVADRREAVFARFVRGILQHLGNDELRVTVACSVAGRAALASHIREDRFAFEYVTIPQSLSLAAAAIQALAVDILFYLEVGTDSFGYFLPFYQCAPVQCTSWGVPVTSGMPSMQYFISSELLEPAGAKDHYSEQLIRLPTLPVYYERPQPLARRTGRESLGLLDNQHLYLCPQSLFKFHPDFDEALGDILRSDPQGLLVLIEAEHPHWTQSLAHRFSQTMPDVVDRVRFMPRQNPEAFMNLLDCCDVMLDPFHFGGGATTYDALALGIPIVTLPGEYMRGRVTSACYQKMGFTECVAESVEQYVSLAVTLGTEPELREQLRSRILCGNEVLYEDGQAVDELRTFFLEAAHAAR